MKDHVVPRLQTDHQSILDEIMKGLSDIICSNAERKSYGVKEKDAITYLDESPNALWSWELTNSSLLP